jgi:asparagine synthase (glutamine-hydrolysing)
VAYARLVANRYRTEHHEMKVEPDMVSVLPEIVRRYGEPFADTSAVPVYYLSKMTREHVKVALSGDGGDETFAGYRRYLWQALSRGARRLPGPVWRAAAGVLSRLSAPRSRPLREFGRYLSRPAAERYLSFVAHFAPEDKLRLRGPALQQLRGGAPGDPVLEDFARRLAEAPADDDVNRLLSLDTETYLADDILTKVDIASMAHALEVRAPLVDHVLMERMASLPGSLKLRGFRGKRLLRAAVRDLVPAPILSRRKKGFSLPVDGWFRGELREMTRDLLGDRTCRERGLVDPAAVGALLDEQDAGADHGERLWNLLVLELWFRHFIDGASAGLGARSLPAAAG